MSAIVERKLIISDYEFDILINPANVVAQMQRDVFYKTQGMDVSFVRSFFFDDIVPEKVNQFCEQFALDKPTRIASLQRTSDWAITNDLFLRNCFNPYFQPNSFLEQVRSLVNAYTFFKKYAVEIVHLPQYEQIYQGDNAIQPHPHQPDPAIADIVSTFNLIESVATLSSCQGVSSTVSYKNYDILTLSPHARFAYLWFSSMPTEIASEIRHMTLHHTIYRDDIYPMLVSTGDNSAFLDELTLLVQKLMR